MIYNLTNRDRHPHIHIILLFYIDIIETPGRPHSRIFDVIFYSSILWITSGTLASKLTDCFAFTIHCWHSIC